MENVAGNSFKNWCFNTMTFEMHLLQLLSFQQIFLSFQQIFHLLFQRDIQFWRPRKYFRWVVNCIRWDVYKIGLIDILYLLLCSFFNYYLVKLLRNIVKINKSLTPVLKVILIVSLVFEVLSSINHYLIIYHGFLWKYWFLYKIRLILLCINGSSLTSELTLYSVSFIFLNAAELGRTVNCLNSLANSSKC